MDVRTIHSNPCDISALTNIFFQCMRRLESDVRNTLAPRGLARVPDRRSIYSSVDSVPLLSARSRNAIVRMGWCKSAVCSVIRCVVFKDYCMYMLTYHNDDKIIWFDMNRFIFWPSVLCCRNPNFNVSLIILLMILLCVQWRRNTQGSRPLCRDAVNGPSPLYCMSI